MSPITRSRKPGFPHQIALLAAAVCLVLSFTMDQTTDEDHAPSHANTAVQVEHGDEPVTVTVQARERAAQTNGQPRSSAVRLSPWFRGLSH